MKKLNNNLVIEYDKARDLIFGLYDHNVGQCHDAGFDAYMTGHIFLCISKYIEIGKIIGPKENALSQTSSLSQGTVPCTKPLKLAQVKQTPSSQAAVVTTPAKKGAKKKKEQE